MHSDNGDKIWTTVGSFPRICDAGSVASEVGVEGSMHILAAQNTRGPSIPCGKQPEEPPQGTVQNQQ